MTSNEASPRRPVRINRDDVAVVYLTAGGDSPEQIGQAWTRLEKILPLRGRKFLGVFFPELSEYRACSHRLPTDDPSAVGLQEYVVPGGAYSRIRLEGEPPEVYEGIPRTIQLLESSCDVDSTRPYIEYYRRRDVVDVIVPIR